MLSTLSKQSVQDHSATAARPRAPGGHPYYRAQCIECSQQIQLPETATLDLPTCCGRSMFPIHPIPTFERPG